MPADSPAAIPGTAPAASPFAQPVNPEAQRLAAQPPKEPTRIPAKAPAPTAFERANMSPNERHQIDTSSALYDPTKTVQVRGERGEIIFKDRATGQVLDAGGEIDPNAPPVDPVTTGEKFKVGEFEVSEQEIRDLMAGKAERDLARADIPAQPADYKVEIPEISGLPEGTVVALGDDFASQAMVESAKNWAHKNGLSQDAFNELVAIQAHSVVAEQQNYNRLAAENLAALGANGPQRIDSLTTWIRSQVGDKDAKPIIATMATAAHVRFFEKMQHRIASQGAATFGQTGRVAESTGVDDATYNAMSYSEKKAYAERASSPGNRR